MANIITNLKDKSDNTLYPITKTECVYDSNSNSVESLFDGTTFHDDSVTTVNETTFADNYYTKTQGDSRYFVKGQEGFYATYSFPNGENSFRFKICDAGDFDKFDYEFVIRSNSITAQGSVCMRFGSSSEDLDTEGRCARLCAYWSGTSAGSGTIESYQFASGNYSLHYIRSANMKFWGNVNIASYGDVANWTSLLGQTPSGDIAYRLGYNTVSSSNVTHARFYTTSGNFSGTGGTITVYRKQKVFS